MYKYKIISGMQQGNSKLYHGHILTNIKRFQDRKNSYINHRLSFLRQFCEPISQRIKKVKQQIVYYQQKYDNQNEFIENIIDIVDIKKSIEQYKQTKAYFCDHVNEYQKKAIQLELNNSKIKNYINNLNNRVSELSREEFIKGVQTISNVINQQAEEQSQHSRKQSFLPSINRAPDRYYQSVILRKMKKRSAELYKKSLTAKNVQNLEHSLTRQDSSIMKINNQEENVISIREQITNFDKLQSLFQQCFQKKKQGVQKSVTQLQPRIIKNKEIFLNACQVIGQKKDNLSVEQFCQLTTDEIMTLFISFGWLSRKLNHQFSLKRKKIIQYVKKLPSV